LRGPDQCGIVNERQIGISRVTRNQPEGSAMRMTGMYRISLLPNADAPAFEKQMTDVVFSDVSALQLTRITQGFDHRLLRRQGEFREYVWHVTVDLVTDHGYDFAENIERVQAHVANWGVVTGLDVFTNIQA
jgi:hypothetical protein